MSYGRHCPHGARFLDCNPPDRLCPRCTAAQAVFADRMLEMVAGAASEPLDPRGGVPPHPNAKDGHGPEYAALSAFLAARGARRGVMEARETLLCVLGLADDVDRIRDAFQQRLARQRSQGDIKGAAATKSALDLIDDTLRRERSPVK